MDTLLLAVTVASLLIVFVTSGSAWKRARESRERTAARVEALRALAFADELPAMFGSTAERGAPKGRWIAVAAVAAIMASIAGTAFALHQVRPSEPSHSAGTSLDLLMLRHMTDRHGTFIVTGQVRNSRSGESLQGVSAFVDLLDRHGRRVAGEKMAVPVPPGGDGSSFTVAVPKTAGVARYRVQFRLEDGSAVPHIDRRASSVGQAAERTGHARLE